MDKVKMIARLDSQAMRNENRAKGLRALAKELTDMADALDSQSNELMQIAEALTQEAEA